jgi:hypothetical protein
MFIHSFLMIGCIVIYLMAFSLSPLVTDNDQFGTFRQEFNRTLSQQKLSACFEFPPFMPVDILLCSSILVCHMMYKSYLTSPASASSANIMEMR